ncbi:hypothetical protein A2949_01645 [Candidatus Adlerbacteria bacterium RIFCSPLOWO2_01_FULL_54_21b]|uniref:ABC transporter ATP-binding protein n=1 Tax=Candidatus Adlerbacteria bacterium RIFCSPLOWO2_01_FULL_54_21b TaxID=1797245 RepID=A0A1F4XWM7_9BACT|nr:MAG: hypothetical protein A2949_01645 [Candidatus Adlerbacteria bacterium RIFCSPLOWO2_01_FULL_54_21b]
MLSTIKTMWGVFRAYRWHLFWLVALGFTGALLEGVGINAAIPLLSFLTGGDGVPADPISRAIASVFAFVHIPFSFRYLLIFIVGLFLLRAVAVALFAFIRGWIVADFLSTESREMFRRLLESSWPYLLKQKIGHLHNTLVRDIQRTSSLFDMTTQIIQSATGFLMYFTVAFIISPLMTLLALVGAGVLLGTIRPLLRRTVDSGAKMATSEKQIAQFLSEHIIGMKLVKAGGVAREALRQGQRLLLELRYSYVRIMLVRAISGSLFQPFSIIFVVFLFFVMYQTPDFSIISFAATLYLIQKIFTYAESAQSSLHGLGEVLPYVRNVLQFKKELEDSREVQLAGGEPFIFKRALELKNVSLSYGKKRVLRDFSCTVKRGEVVGIVGPSGAGKTSVADILLRLFTPDNGEVLLDGVPMERISIDEWRAHVGYVPQEVFLFNESVEENVRFYRDIPREQVIEALRQANIYDTVTALPEGLATHIGDRGVMLSGGQRQRIALARALAGNPSILVLDEATSALDSESEGLIQESILALRGRVTVIMIAHRLSTIEKADTILVLKDGRVTEQGSFRELRTNPESYILKHSA